MIEDEPGAVCACSRAGCKQRGPCQQGLEARKPRCLGRKGSLLWRVVLGQGWWHPEPDVLLHTAVVSLH